MIIRIINEKKITPLIINNLFESLHSIQSSPTALNTNKSPQKTIYIHKQTHQSMHTYAQQSNTKEVGGAILGYYIQQNNQIILLITDVFHQPLNYHLEQTQIKFTTQFYSDLDKYCDELEKTKPNILRLGLYHTHPNYGVFLSKQDASTFKNIFKEEWQLAMIIDPVKQKDGIFYWLSNKEISDVSSYQLFDSNNPIFNPSPITNSNNSLLSTNYTKKVEQTNPYPTPNSSPIIVNIEQVHKKKCPIFNSQYGCRQIYLEKYAHHLNITKLSPNFPYYLLINKNLNITLTEYLKNNNQAIGLLTGCVSYDEPHQIPYIEIDNVNLIPNLISSPVNIPLIQTFLKQQIANNKLIIGWLYHGNPCLLNLSQATQLHLSLFNQMHHLGMFIDTNKTNSNLLEQCLFISYNNTQKTFFDNFKNVFLYHKI